MYFVKSRKHIEEQDALDHEKSNKNNKYQRSDSARLLLQTVGPAALQTQTSVDQKQENKAPASGFVSKHGQFRPEELPDSACYRPKKENRPLSPTNTIDNGISSAFGPSVVDTIGTAHQQVEASSAVVGENEWLRPAEYIGTFSVSGSDKQAREKQMEIQLQQMRGVSTVTPVHLVISVEGVKVLNIATQSPIMEHSLKRIWYATCDPEFCQFSFLAREPKTSAEVQYCHAFLTKTSEEAEELISLMGNAFKATMPLPPSTAASISATKKPPTFHELIEQQVQEQQAKFREIEKESKLALQKKLTEIATPTPFSEKAQYRIGARRFSDGGSVDAHTNKMWAKQLLAHQMNHHAVGENIRRSNNNNNNKSNLESHRRSEIPVSHSNSQQSSPCKRNSVPPQVRENIIGSSSSSVPSSPAHPLSAQAIRESLGSKQSSSKFKGSPVTALKNEIDKRLLLDESAAFPPVPKPDVPSSNPGLPKPSMANRPLPSPPEESAQEPRGRSRGGRSADARVRRSLDDNNLPAGQPGEGQVRMRNSPRRGQARPMSEIAVGSSSAAYLHQQRQSLLQNFASSFNSPRELEAAASAAPGVPTSSSVPASSSQDRLNNISISSNNKRNSYSGTGNLYIPAPHHMPLQQQLSEPAKLSSSHSNHNSPIRNQQHNYHRSGKVVERRERSGGPEGGRKRSDPSLPPFMAALPPQCQPHLQLQQQNNEPELYEELVEDDGIPSGKMEILRYQNGSPFYQGDYDGISMGLESLMNLDRSHIHDITLRNSPWYQAGLAREIALDLLQQEEVGAFIVRDSSTHPGCFALSVRVPKFENSSGISHYLILRTHRGVKLKGLEKEWSTLHALVIHHTVMREMLPCTLRLPKTAPPMSAEEIRSSGDGMERGDNYTDMSTTHGGGGHLPVLNAVGGGGKNF